MEPAFSVGFNSAIVTSLNAFPRYSKGILKAVKENRLQDAIDLQQNLTMIMNILTKYGKCLPFCLCSQKCVPLSCQVDSDMYQDFLINIIIIAGSKVPGVKLSMNLFTPVNVGLARPPLQNLSPQRIQDFKSELEPYL